MEAIVYLEATGFDEIPGRVLKDAAPEIAKPIAYLINLTILTGIIPQEWKEAKVAPIFKSAGLENGVKKMMSTTTVRSPCFRLSQR